MYGTQQNANLIPIEEPPEAALLSPEERTRLRKLAGYLSWGVAPKEAGAAVGLSVSRISQLSDETNEAPSARYFQAIFEQIAGSNATKAVDTAQTIREIETAALNNIHSALRWNGDPDFSLKVLSVVSKTKQFNGYLPQQPSIDAVKGAQAVLNLNIAFVNKAQNGEIVIAQAYDKRAKETNFMNPQAVQQLLHDNSPLQQSVTRVRKMFDDMELIPFVRDGSKE